MKFISITKSINIRPDWASIGARLKAGTPLDITGAVANSSAAVGILADDAEKSSAEVAVVTEGSIDLAEVAASYGELEDDCIAAIKGISFIDADGDPIVPSGGGGGSGVLKVFIKGNNQSIYTDDSLTSTITWGEVYAAYNAGTPILFLPASYGEVYFFPQFLCGVAVYQGGIDDVTLIGYSNGNGLTFWGLGILGTTNKSTLTQKGTISED